VRRRFLVDSPVGILKVHLERRPYLGGRERSLRDPSPDGMRRVTGSAATVPANTTTAHLCHYDIYIWARR